MKTETTKIAPAPSNLITLTIERETFVLPPGKNIGEVLEALAGLRKVKLEEFYYMEPNRRVLVDCGEAEMSVSASRREVVDGQEFSKLKKADDEAREAERAKRAEEANRKEGI
jgi:hypothetical protein